MNMMNDIEKDDGFCINVYSPGNFIAKTISIGTLNMGSPSQGNGFSDEQIAQALMACVGKDKVINNKQKWAGAYWCLRHKCFYPADSKEFCKKIESLKLEVPDDMKCDYNNIRRYCTRSFMDYDPFGKDEVKVSNMDRDAYSWIRPIAFKIAEELGKTVLPRV